MTATHMARTSTAHCDTRPTTSANERGSELVSSRNNAVRERPEATSRLRQLGFLKFERLLETYLAFAPKGFRSFRMAIPLWLKEKLFQKQLLRDELRAFDSNFDWETKLLFTEH